MPRPAGLLLVSEVFPPAIGGSGFLLEQIYSRLSGIDVRVLADVPPAPGPVRRGRLTVHPVSMAAPDWGIAGPSSLWRHVRVAAAIRRLSSTSGAVHCARALPEGLSALLAQWTGGLPFVCWTHGEELGFASTSRELRWLTRRVFERAQAVIANSAHSKHLLVADWALPDSKVHVVHPGVDTERFRPGLGSEVRQRVGGHDEVLFLTVGRLQRRKGHDVALAALARLRSRGSKARYLIVGDGPERQSLEAQAFKLGLDGSVLFAGAVAESDLPAWFAAADVFLLPNRQDGVDFEGFGIVFLEAAAAGLPTIGGRSGGVPEAIAEGETGLLVSGTDPDELATAMGTLIDSPELRARMGEAGRRRATTSFSWDRAVERLAACSL